jgi:hypothetical protein
MLLATAGQSSGTSQFHCCQPAHSTVVASMFQSVSVPLPFYNTKAPALKRKQYEDDSLWRFCQQVCPHLLLALLAYSRHKFLQALNAALALSPKPSSTF